jgi:hypothetical protein
MLPEANILIISRVTDRVPVSTRKFAGETKPNLGSRRITKEPGRESSLVKEWISVSNNIGFRDGEYTLYGEKRCMGRLIAELFPHSGGYKCQRWWLIICLTWHTFICHSTYTVRRREKQAFLIT